MKKNFLALLLSLSLIAVIVTGITGCSDRKKAEETTTAVSETTIATTSETAATTSEPAETVSMSEETAVGEGAQQFLLTVTERDGSAVKFNVSTDETIVGNALLSLGLISGSESEYGLMVDTVNGGKCDFNADGYYWAFYIDGEYAMTGVDSTPIEKGKSYELRAQQ